MPRWTPEARAEQARKIHNWEPWRHSTGPKSWIGKSKASKNALLSRRNVTAFSGLLKKIDALTPEDYRMATIRNLDEVEAGIAALRVLLGTDGKPDHKAVVDGLMGLVEQLQGAAEQYVDGLKKSKK